MKLFNYQKTLWILFIGFFFAIPFSNAQIANQWTGSVSSDWNVAGNWTQGVPQSGHDVTIPNGSGIVEINGVAVARSVEILGSSLEILTTGDLTVDGNGLTSFGLYTDPTGLLVNEGVLSVFSTDTGIDNNGTFNNVGNALMFVNETLTGIRNSSLFTNASSAYVEVVLATTGIENTGDISTYGTILVHNGLGVGILNFGGGSLVNRIAAEVTIQNVIGDGIINQEDNSTIFNQGIIRIEENIGANGVTNSDSAFWANWYNAELIIRDVADTRFANQSEAVVINQGFFILDQLSANQGIENSTQASFTNGQWGSVSIAFTVGDGLLNDAGAEFINDGALNFVDGIAQHAIENHGTFTNEDMGSIQIDQADLTGILNDGTATFETDGTITISDGAVLDGIRCLGSSTFETETTSVVYVGANGNIGTYVGVNATVKNKGIYEVQGSFAGPSVMNEGVVNNLSCATLECWQYFQNESTAAFLNRGLFVTHVVGQSNVNLGSVTNLGIFNEINGPSWQGPVNNLQVILNPIYSPGNAPVPSALIGVPPFSLTVVNNEFYLDAGQTNVYATYDPLLNELTPVNLNNPVPPASITIYATFEDPQTGCTYAVEIPLEVTACPLYYVDADGDMYGDVNDPGTEYCSGPPPGYVPDNTDCDDADNATYPGAPELCDGIDRNCDGLIEPVTYWYVNANSPAAQDMQDGMSWATAFDSLQHALDAAANNQCNEIWVAEGTYAPTEFVDWGVQGPNGAHKAFHARDDMRILGGFPDAANPGLADRDPSLYPSILTGNRGMGTNSFHVLRVRNISPAFLLDGFIIQDGIADGPQGFPQSDKGGGLWIENGSPTVSNCTFQLNEAVQGGAVYNNNGAPVFIKCMFVENTAPVTTLGGTVGGGAIYNKTGDAEFYQCAFTGNDASYGGAVYIQDADLIFSKCIFSGNTASSEGGAIRMSKGNTLFENCILEGNVSGATGGVLYNRRGTPSFIHCTLYGNSSTGSQGPVLYNILGTPSILNTIVWDNDTGLPIVDFAGTTTIENSILEFGCGSLSGCNGSTVWDLDPLFADASMSDFQLQSGSPAVDLAVDAYGIIDDYAGNIRPVGPAPDAGAYESSTNFLDNCLDFDGVNDFVNVPISPIPGSVDFTIEAWFRSVDLDGNDNASSCGGNFERILGFGGDRLEFGECAGQFALYSLDTDVEVTGPTTGDCMWHHMAATKTGNILTIYIDGQFIDDFTGSFDLGTGGFNIGSWVGASGNFWPGQIDEVRIWDFAKSQMQIQNEMNIELQGTEPGLLAYYPMNQGVASGDNGSGCPSGMPCEDILQDVTGNGFDGVLQNFLLSGPSSNFIYDDPTLNELCNFSIQFDGTDDRILFGPNSALNTDHYTIEGWFQTSATTDQTILNYLDVDGLSHIMVEILADGTLHYQHDAAPQSSNGADLWSVPGLNDGNWHHFAAVKENVNEHHLYVDGQWVQTVSLPCNPMVAIQSGTYGSNDVSFYFSGSLDDVRIWTEARTATDIANNLNTELTGTEPMLFSYYKFNTGNSDCDVVDYTVNGNHGIRSGGGGTNFRPQYQNVSPVAISVPFNQSIGCQSIFLTIDPTQPEVHETHGAEEEAEMPTQNFVQRSLYPNPTTGQLYLKLQAADTELLVSDLTGRILQVLQLNGQERTELDLSNLPAGMYLITVQNANGVQWQEKVIRQ